MVLLGLIFVNFFPLKSLPNINPPISEKIQIEIKNNILGLKLFCEIPEKTTAENIIRYIKLDACIVNLKKLDFSTKLKTTPFGTIMCMGYQPTNQIKTLKETICSCFNNNTCTLLLLLCTIDSTFSLFYTFFICSNKVYIFLI